MTPLSETSVEEQFNNFNNELDLENQVLYDLNIKVNIHQSKLTLTPPEMTIDLGKFHDRVHHGNKHNNYDEFSNQTARQRHHQVKPTEIHLPGLQMNLKYFSGETKYDTEYIPIPVSTASTTKEPNLPNPYIVAIPNALRDHPIRNFSSDSHCTTNSVSDLTSNFHQKYRKSIKEIKYPSKLIIGLSFATKHGTEVSPDLLYFLEAMTKKIIENEKAFPKAKKNDLQGDVTNNNNMKNQSLGGRTASRNYSGEQQNQNLNRQKANQSAAGYNFELLAVQKLPLNVEINVEIKKTTIIFTCVPKSLVCSKISIPDINLGFKSDEDGVISVEFNLNQMALEIYKKDNPNLHANQSFSQHGGFSRHHGSSAGIGSHNHQHRYHRETRNHHNHGHGSNQGHPRPIRFLNTQLDKIKVVVTRSKVSHDESLTKLNVDFDIDINIGTGFLEFDMTRLSIIFDFPIIWYSELLTKYIVGLGHSGDKNRKHGNNQKNAENINNNNSTKTAPNQGQTTTQPSNRLWITIFTNKLSIDFLECKMYTPAEILGQSNFFVKSIKSSSNLLFTSKMERDISINLSCQEIGSESNGHIAGCAILQKLNSEIRVDQKLNENPFHQFKVSFESLDLRFAFPDGNKLLLIHSIDNFEIVICDKWISGAATNSKNSGRGGGLLFSSTNPTNQKNFVMTPSGAGTMWATSSTTNHRLAKSHLSQQNSGASNRTSTPDGNIANSVYLILDVKWDKLSVLACKRTIPDCYKSLEILKRFMSTQVKQSQRFYSSTNRSKDNDVYSYQNRSDRGHSFDQSNILNSSSEDIYGAGDPGYSASQIGEHLQQAQYPEMPTSETTTSKPEKEIKDPRRKIYNHRRHWPPVFEELEKWISPVKDAGTPTSDDESRSLFQLGGICSISGMEIDLALFEGDDLHSSNWACVRIAEPCAVMESSAMQSNEGYKSTEVKQNMFVMLGSRSVVDELIQQNSFNDEKEDINDFYNVNIQDIIDKYKKRANTFYDQEKEKIKQGIGSPSRKPPAQDPQDALNSVYAIFCKHHRAIPSNLSAQEMKIKKIEYPNHKNARTIIESNRHWIKYACESTSNSSYFRNRTTEQLENLTKEYTPYPIISSTFIEIPATICRYNSYQKQPPGKPSIYDCCPLDLEHRFVTNFLQEFGITTDFQLYEFCSNLISNYGNSIDEYKITLRHEEIRQFLQEHGTQAYMGLNPMMGINNAGVPLIDMQSNNPYNNFSSQNHLHLHQPMAMFPNGQIVPHLNGLQMNSTHHPSHMDPYNYQNHYFAQNSNTFIPIQNNQHHHNNFDVQSLANSYGANSHMLSQTNLHQMPPNQNNHHYSNINMITGNPNNLSMLQSINSQKQNFSFNNNQNNNPLLPNISQTIGQQMIVRKDDQNSNISKGSNAQNNNDKNNSNPNSDPNDALDILKDDCRKFHPIDWYLQPKVRFVYARKRLEPPGIDTIFKRIGFKAATDTIPKVIQRKLCDNLDKVFSLMLMRMTLFVLSLENERKQAANVDDGNNKESQNKK